MLANWVVIVAAFGYIGLLFAIASYGDRVSVSAWFRDVDRRLSIGYEVVNLTQARRAARGRTDLVVVDREDRMLFETPQVLRDRIHAASLR